MKRKIVLGILISVFFLTVFGFFVPANYFGVVPQYDDFKLTVDLSSQCQTGEDVAINVRLKNKSLKAYSVIYGQDFFNISCVEKGDEKENTAITIGRKHYISPKQLLSEEEVIEITEEGEYTVFVDVIFSVSDETYKYRESVDILVK